MNQGKIRKNQVNELNQAEELLNNIDKIHTTTMGIDRIKRNLNLGTDDVVNYCIKKILDTRCSVYRLGKNWYCEVDNIRITTNASSYSIITAHIIK